MVTVLQAVELAERCFLSEVLLWLALKRLPLAMYNTDGDESRFSDENGFYTGESIQDFVTDAECAFAGLPPNPEYRAWMEDKLLHSDDFYEKMLALDLNESERERLLSQRVEAAEFSKTLSRWNETYESYLDYFKARIFVDLREGKLQATGIQIPGKNEKEARDYIEGEELDLSKQPVISIRQDEWMARKIDWESSALFGDEYTYCWVQFSTESVLAVYPVPSLPPLGTVISLGDVYILDKSNDRELTTSTRRGRPSLPWEQFHLEVAALARENALPEKKEAAIHQFESWFRDELGIRVGRSSIGQRLTPYYDRFVRAQPKIGGN